MAQDLLARALPNQLGALPDRFINAVLTDGVWDLSADHFKVQQQASPGMSVRAGSGAAFDKAVVTGAVAGQETFIVRNQDPYVGSGNTDLSIGNGDPSDPRVDLVVLQVYENEVDSSGSTMAELRVVPGTPAASPSAPATPAGAIALASVLVAPNESTSITDGDITDLRSEAHTRGMMVERLVITSTEVVDWTSRPWVRKVIAKLQAAGGGSGGVASTTAGQAAASGAGAGGEYVEKEIDGADLGSSTTVTIGAPGTAGGASGSGTANPGGDAGDVTVGAHATAVGGKGGQGALGATPPAASLGTGGVGGTGGTGDLKVPGDHGQTGLIFAGRNTPAAGGGSHLGGQTTGGATSSGAGGTAGKDWGGGAPGAINGASQSARAGGVGGAGIVILDLYA